MSTELTREDRTRITDSTHNIQAAEEILSGVAPQKIPGFTGIVSCLRDAEKTLRGLLRSFRPPVSKQS